MYGNRSQPISVFFWLLIHCIFATDKQPEECAQIGLKARIMDNKKTNAGEAPKGYVNAKDAAQFLGVSLGFLYKLTSANRLPFYKPFGKHICFKLAELETYVQSGRVPTRAELEKGGAR